MRQVVAAMSEMEERLLAAVEKLAEKVERMGLIQEKLEAMDKKLEKQGERLDQVQTKVDLSMESLGQVHQEQIQSLAGGAARSTVSDRDPNPDAGRDLVGDSRTTLGNNSKSSSVTNTQG